MEDHVVLCPQLKCKVESPARAVTHKVLFINNDTCYSLDVRDFHHQNETLTPEQSRTLVYDRRANFLLTRVTTRLANQRLLRACRRDFLYSSE
ncbi:hypothetical protein EYF80_004241 [Liparis tanakae]|uniref:Uncharacterized protein n=1 Tax=Liparis tanakae TaxID=230148 RepID=A0A4Z2J7E9_9TELE|nr:hypothetical protein EYF80_004241 [Liparis tanakae]